MQPKHLWAIIAALGIAVIVLSGLLVFRAGQDSARSEPPRPQMPVLSADQATAQPERATPIRTPPTDVPAPVPQAPSRVDYGYTFDLPKNEPALYAKWKRAVRGFDTQRYPWLRGLDGVAVPIRPVLVEGQSYYQGAVCEPHNCGSNQVIILFPADESRIVGRLKITDDVTFRETITGVGRPTTREQTCLERLAENSEATVC